MGSATSVPLHGKGFLSEIVVFDVSAEAQFFITAEQAGGLEQ